jgi:peptidoglycan/xylan/chitin deacetylase (PgdA/CDA1 family)
MAAAGVSAQASATASTAEPGLYDYFPYVDRPKIVWPGGARLAFWCAPNIEFYELNPPPNPDRTAWPRPVPDVLNYGWRDYGNRSGVWRMMEVMDRHGVRGSVSLNVALCDHFPDIVAACVERNWELFSHGIYNTRYTYGMDEAQERAMIRDVKATIKKYSGQDLAGWLAPALTNTNNTIRLLAEEGVRYTLDLFHDDQPLPVKVPRGRLISLPYSLEINDFTVLHQGAATPRQYVDMVRAQFDRLYAEGARSGTVMCLPLHPFLIGQPHRIEALAEMLDYVTSHAGVWVTTAREIADHYYANYYDQFTAAIAAHRGAGR